jgi:uncharacterized protein YbjT (DUF2867 family)
MKTAVIAGCTGLIGAQVLDLLLKDDHFSSVIALSRKPLEKTNPRLQNLVIDFEELEKQSLSADVVFCCLGTTIKQAGSQEAFRKVDFDYPLALARVTQRLGAKKFLIVTALGSDKNSSIFYNRVKGEVQEAVTNLGFESVHVLQPSLLLGHRAVKRAGEGAGELVMKALDFLIPRKYKAIDSARVARAMISFAKKDEPGVFYHLSGELQDY